MNTVQMEAVLTTHPDTKCIFVGVFPRDHIPSKKIKSFPAAFVFNTDPSTKKGEHWIALYFEDSKRGFYFDSYGLPPIHKIFESFMGENSKIWTYNDICLQSLDSNVCGHYCIYYIIQKCKGLNAFAKFTYDTYKNDVFVRSYVNKIIKRYRFTKHNNSISQCCIKRALT
jgi:hypothetical protein